MVHISFWFMLMMLIIMSKRKENGKENAEALIVASKGIGLDANADKTE